MTLGFVSGRFDETFLSRLDFFRSLGCNALELHPNRKELATKRFSSAEVAAIREFTHVSLHYVRDDVHFELANQVDKWLQELPIKIVVVHPRLDLDIPTLASKHWPIALENMDATKETARTVDSMQEWFTKVPNAQMVLDINHCFTNDSSLKLAEEMYASFKNKIVEIHFSGYLDKEHIHEPITTSGCEHLLTAIPNKNLPIIIEVYVSNLNDETLRKEFETIRNYLNS